VSRWFSTKSDESYADAAEYLCRHDAEVREAVGEQCWAAQIPVITTAQPSSTQWREAIRAVHDAAEAADIPGGLGLRFPMGGEFPAAPAPRSAGWVCPGRCCSRVVLRDASTSAQESSEPLCGLVGRPMRLVE
jgi:hypothetical protein